MTTATDTTNPTPSVIDSVPGIDRAPQSTSVEVPRLSSPAGMQALLRGQTAALDAVREAAVPGLEEARAAEAVVEAALTWFASEPGAEARNISALDVACSRLVELRGGVR